MWAGPQLTLYIQDKSSSPSLNVNRKWCSCQIFCPWMKFVVGGFKGIIHTARIFNVIINNKCLQFCTLIIKDIVWLWINGKTFHSLRRWRCDECVTQWHFESRCRLCGKKNKTSKKRTIIQWMFFHRVWQVRKFGNHWDELPWTFFWNEQCNNNAHYNSYTSHSDQLPHHWMWCVWGCW